MDIPIKLNYWVIPALQKRYNVTHEVVINEVCKRTGVTYEELKSKCRKRHLVEARYLYAYIMKKKSNYSLEKIGSQINRDHSMMIYYNNMFESIASYNTDMFLNYVNICNSIF